jgi:hypothetical protein
VPLFIEANLTENRKKSPSWIADLSSSAGGHGFIQSGSNTSKIASVKSFPFDTSQLASG